MPRNVLVLLAVAVLSVVLEGAGPPAARADERWRRPLPGGAVVGSFSFERSAPYVRGRRRGIDVAGRPGARVLAVCGGVVTHAGGVPGFGRGVTVRCGGLVATELGLSSLAVARGARVVPGAALGRLAAGGVLRLGARVASDRHGYVDPRALLRDPTTSAPPVAPPPAVVRRRRAARPPRPGTAPGTVPATRVAAGARAASAGSATALHWPVPAGLALLTAGLAGGGAARVHRRRQARGRIALAQR
jgi:hypothetical protein